MSDYTPKVHRNVSLPAGTHPPEIIRRTYSESDAETSANAGVPSGGSSSSSISCKSNESAGQSENQDSHSEWSDEEENSEPWSTKASKEILSNMSMNARKRQDLIHELIQTEVSHVRWLRILHRVFYIPLQRNSLLPTAEFKALFPNLLDVLQYHRKLSVDLKALAAVAPVVKTKPLAEILINTLGESKFSIDLAKFCKGQRLALDTLREKQKRSKELYSFLARQEQEPLCARRRLQDFLACVWQRLTKYKLLLEGIIKTGKEENESEETEGLSKLSIALDLAKDVLHNVNTAITTTENEHRLKAIQSKLEIRGVSGMGGSESDPGELKKLDLVKHSLVMEGNLVVRQDSTKRITVYALMLSDCLVLLQKEGDRFILRPISSDRYHQPLSPVIHWNTVFFRTNAAVKNGFFLVNINGVQMYDMAVTNSSEYNTWIRFLSESAKALGPRSGTTDEGVPPPLPSNPPPVMLNNNSEDIPIEIPEPNTSAEEEKKEATPPPQNEDDGTEVKGVVPQLVREKSEERQNRVKFAEDELLTPSSVDITSPPPAMTAYRQLTSEERLRQAEEKVVSALREAAEAAREISDTPSSIYSAMETLLGKSAISDRQWKTSVGNGLNYDRSSPETEQHSNKHLLLAAQNHVDNLTEVLFRALRVSPADCAMTRCSVHTSYGLCDTCFAKHSKYLASSEKANKEVKPTDGEDSNQTVESTDGENADGNDSRDGNFVMLEDVGESSTDPYDVQDNPTESDSQIVAASSIGLREILATLIQRLPAEEQERELLRARLQQADQRLHRLHHIHRDCVHPEDGPIDNTQEVPDAIPNDQSEGG